MFGGGEGVRSQQGGDFFPLLQTNRVYQTTRQSSLPTLPSTVSLSLSGSLYMSQIMDCQYFNIQSCQDWPPARRAELF